MKDKLFKYALVVVLSSMAYFAIATYDQKDACAEGECLEIASVAMEFIGAISAIMSGDTSAISALSFVGQYIDNIKQMTQSFTDFYNDALKQEAEETKEMMQKIARQHRAANIAVTGQWGSIKESAAMIKKTTRYQRSQVDTIGRRFPAASNQVCRQTNQLVRENQTQNYIEFEQAVSRENNRRRSGGVKSPNDYSARPFNQFGPNVRQAMMIEETKNYCYSDEHLQNVRWGYHNGTWNQMCWRDSTSNAMYDDIQRPSNYGSYLAGDLPLTQMNFSYHLPYIKEMIVPVPLMAPMPKSTARNRDVQDAYMAFNSTLARTAFNEYVVDYLAATRQSLNWSVQQFDAHNSDGADPLIPMNYTGIIRPCMRALDMVRETYNEVYGHPILESYVPNSGIGDRCPGQQTLDHATMLSVSSASGLGSILAQEEGNMKQAELYIYILRQKLEFNIHQKQEMLTFQKILDQIGSNTGGEMPVDAIGRAP